VKAKNENKKPSTIQNLSGSARTLGMAKNAIFDKVHTSYERCPFNHKRTPKDGTTLLKDKSS